MAPVPKAPEDIKGTGLVGLRRCGWGVVAGVVVGLLRSGRYGPLACKQRATVPRYATPPTLLLYCSPTPLLPCSPPPLLYYSTTCLRAESDRPSHSHAPAEQRDLVGERGEERALAAPGGRAVLWLRMCGQQKCTTSVQHYYPQTLAHPTGPLTPSIEPRGSKRLMWGSVGAARADARDSAEGRSRSDPPAEPGPEPSAASPSSLRRDSLRPLSPPALLLPAAPSPPLPSPGEVAPDPPPPSLPPSLPPVAPLAPLVAGHLKDAPMSSTAAAPGGAAESERQYPPRHSGEVLGPEAAAEGLAEAAGSAGPSERVAPAARRAERSVDASGAGGGGGEGGERGFRGLRGPAGASAA